MDQTTCNNSSSRASPDNSCAAQVVGHRLKLAVTIRMFNEQVCWCAYLQQSFLSNSDCVPTFYRKTFGTPRLGHLRRQHSTGTQPTVWRQVTQCVAYVASGLASTQWLATMMSVVKPAGAPSWKLSHHPDRLHRRAGGECELDLAPASATSFKVVNGNRCRDKCPGRSKTKVGLPFHIQTDMTFRDRST